MTSATERLRELLDERGVKYETEDLTFIRRTSWYASNGEYVSFYEYPSDCKTKCDYQHLTPEQAIAATLGGGTLTAEQVREAYEKHYHDLPDEYDMPEATALTEYSYNWHAIADELNAALGAGECELEDTIWHDHGIYDSDYYEHTFTCGHTVSWLDSEPPNHCPDCGKAVKR